MEEIVTHLELLMEDFPHEGQHFYEIYMKMHHGYTKQEVREARAIYDKRRTQYVAPNVAPKDADPLSYQVGGDHYTKLKIQPVEYITANELTFLEGCIVGYISRWRNKGDVQDLTKIKQCVDLIIKLENK